MRGLSEWGLGRVEGEGSVEVYVSGGAVAVRVNIEEAPRFFEYLLRGRGADQVVDLVTRVCGLCGVSHALAAAMALEGCLGLEVDERAAELRVAMHLAERVKSHLLHVFLLNLPDYMGVGSAIDLWERRPGLLKRVSSALASSARAMEALCGRTHNVVNLRLGGVYKAPSREEAEAVKRYVEGARRVLEELLDEVLPSLEVPCEGLVKPLLLVHDPGRYPHDGAAVLLEDLGGSLERIEVAGYEAALEPRQERGKNAVVYRVRGRAVVTGPLARFNHAWDRLSGETRDLMKRHGWRPPLRDVRQGIVARLAEVHDALVAIRSVLESRNWDSYAGGGRAMPRRAGGRLHCAYLVEAPRGVLYHRYTLGEDLRVESAKIVTPTQLNVPSMEELSAQALAARPPAGVGDVKRTVEVVVRSLDPCLSCSVHRVVLEA
ncbi:[NiFe] hydrogenase, subunit alpha [Thermogladius calderae 1633]|uniref:[NiFe] hydrogenase, subunit alpha n=1 Tax=Thermogladius calderae (strain DSM 22663 / VKM B-2946 / 1633) TaxID=1184251 RepID=I3TFD8_THEC1|nr:[NiFe] hydrogenase, subunit alpha [Thermogladius calderae 1633]